MRFLPEYQVKQFVAVVQGSTRTRWLVFKTGSDKHYLFSQIDPNGCQTGLQVPVAKRDLKPEIRRALANGKGNASL